MTIDNKYDKLTKYLKKLGKVSIAFSGGVDSTFLLKVAHDTLQKENVTAITCNSPVFSKSEYDFSQVYAKELNVKHIVINNDFSFIKCIENNPADRCYICKKNIFKCILEASDSPVLDGSNFDDNNDYRPGKKALKELNILSPLEECGFTKEDIRILSKKLNVPTFDKPAFSCLATRIPYGEKITQEKLDRIDQCERFLSSKGFKQYRVRHEKTTARIEIPAEDINRLLDNSLRNEIVDFFLSKGFLHVSLDLNGYKMGSMNVDIF